MREAVRLSTALAAILMALPALAAGRPPYDPLMHGALLFHGNYCGPGNRGPGVRPADALDAACRRHDACTPDGRLPSCACNARLHADASRIARDPRQPAGLRRLSAVVSAAATIPICAP